MTKIMGFYLFIKSDFLYWESFEAFKKNSSFDVGSFFIFI